jgi:hypothetical protein
MNTKTVSYKMTKSVFALSLLFSLSILFVKAQSKFIDKTTEISFHSHTPLEDIDATTSSALSILDQSTGDFSFAVLIKSFTFKKALMQVHFNENYIESETYPKSTFKGKIKNLSEVNFQTDGNYPVTVTGNLTIHGVTKEVTVNGIIKISGGKISATSEFSVVPQDYKIEIPGVVRDKIAKEIKISIKADYVPYES